MLDVKRVGGFEAKRTAPRAATSAELTRRDFLMIAVKAPTFVTIKSIGCPRLADGCFFSDISMLRPFAPCVRAVLLSPNLRLDPVIAETPVWSRRGCHDTVHGLTGEFAQPVSDIPDHDSHGHPGLLSAAPTALSAFARV